MSDAGKPLWSRYGGEDSLAGFTAALSAIVAFVGDDGDALRSVGWLGSTADASGGGGDGGDGGGDGDGGGGDGDGGGGDGFPRTLESGRSPVPTCPGTKYPVRGIPHFDVDPTFSY